jgi:hypothetical protein
MSDNWEPLEHGNDGSSGGNNTPPSPSSLPRFPIMKQGSARIRAEARLEDTLAVGATKKCSVEDVSTLHKEFQEWLTSDMEDQVHHLPSSSHSAHRTPPWQTSLSLSAALLRAILMLFS